MKPFSAQRTNQRVGHPSLIVASVVQQHVEDAAILYSTRSTITQAPHVKLHHLLRFDVRIAAHLDGLGVAGEKATRMCEAGLYPPSAGGVFVATMCSIAEQRADRLDRLFVLAETAALPRAGLLAAFGWLGTEQLRSHVAELLSAPFPLKRLAGIAACSMHRVDPGLTAARCFEDPEAMVRARAWRAAGELGKRELVSAAAVAAVDAQLECQFWAAWSAVLLGDRESGLALLKDLAVTPSRFRRRASQLAFQAMTLGSSHTFLQSLAQDPAEIRPLIRGAGLVGDPAYIPWLIGFMTDDKLARLAGESFSLITGLDLAWLDLERKPPENFESGPNDDPNDPNVDMDEDDGLPWPDQKLIQAWWDANSNRFQPGVRYFMGEALNRENCLRVLKEGFQRQRIAAALYLSLLNPGTPLFEWRAPAWRQQRLLATMT